MAGEKTEQPTDKKLRDSRQKGQVARSQDLTQAILFLVAAATLQASGGMVESLRGMMAESYRPEIFRATFSEAQLFRWTGEWWKTALMIQLPLMGSLFFTAAAVGYLQVRGVFSLESIKPSFDKLNPLEGLKRIFAKPNTYIDLFKNLLKLAIIGFLAYKATRGMMREIAFSGRVDTWGIGRLAGEQMFGMLYQAGGAFLVIGVADFLIQTKLHLKELMMTKDEVKREFKDSDGDPHVKHQRKELHHQLLNEAELSNVQSANVVVVNPTHYAVALRYDEATMNAPRVIARGQNLKAAEIRNLASRYHVPVIQDVPLARRLYRVETGHEVPEDLYAPVAEILLWVYELERKQKEGEKR